MSFLNKFSPKKVIRCSNCGTRFKFPVKPGKTLKVTCPNCRSNYQVSFVNPLMQLIKGKLSWKSLSSNEKRKLIIMVMTLIAALGLIASSLKAPVKPTQMPEKSIETYAI
jgi:DNA-directed RNA polymerase subunit RPC12/RpoP